MTASVISVVVGASESDDISNTSPCEKSTTNSRSFFRYRLYGLVSRSPIESATTSSPESAWLTPPASSWRNATICNAARSKNRSISTTRNQNVSSR